MKSKNLTYRPLSQARNNFNAVVDQLSKIVRPSKKKKYFSPAREFSKEELDEVNKRILKQEK